VCVCPLLLFYLCVWLGSSQSCGRAIFAFTAGANNALTSTVCTVCTSSVGDCRWNIDNLKAIYSRRKMHGDFIFFFTRFINRELCVYSSRVMPSARLMVLITTPRLLNMKKEKKKVGSAECRNDKRCKNRQRRLWTVELVFFLLKRL
jgi:hypothetical protein